MSYEGEAVEDRWQINFTVLKRLNHSKLCLVWTLWVRPVSPSHSSGSFWVNHTVNWMLSVCWCSNIFFVQWRHWQVSPQVRSRRCSSLWLRLCVFRSFTGINPDRRSKAGRAKIISDRTGELFRRSPSLWSTLLQNLVDSEWKSLQVSDALNRQQLTCWLSLIMCSG